MNWPRATPMCPRRLWIGRYCLVWGWAWLSMACSISTSLSGPTLQVSITVSRASLPADGVTAATVTVTVQRPDGTPITGAQVALTAPGALLAQPSARTNADGSVTSTLTATQVGTVVISATVSTEEYSVTLMQTAHIVVTGSSTSQADQVPTTLVLNGTASSARAGSNSDVTVAVLDANGVRVADYAGTLAVICSDANATFAPYIAFGSADAGQKTLPGGITWHTVGNQTVTLTDTLTVALSVTSLPLTVTPGPLAKFVFAGPTTLTAGLAASFALTAYDAYANVVTDASDTIDVTATAAQAALPSRYTFVTTDAGSHTFSAALGTAGPQVLTVSIVATPTLSATLAVTVQSGAPATLTLSGPPVTTRAGTALDLVTTVTDANGNIVTDYQGTLQFSATDVQALVPAATLAPGGVKIVTGGVTFKTAGNQQVSVADADAHLQAQVSAVVTAADFTVATLTAQPQAQVADGSRPIALQVQTQDAFGNAVANQNFKLVSSNSVDLLLGKAATTDLQGLASASVTAWTTGTHTITASFATLTARTTVTFTAPACDTLTFAAQATYPISGNGYDLAVGDLNGDGRADVVAGVPNVGFDYLLNQGAGVLNNYTSVATNAGADEVALGDLDNDGLLDMIGAGPPSYEIAVAFNLGSGNFAPQVVYVAGTAPFGLAVADFNADGHLDAATTHASSGTIDAGISLFINQGDGVFFKLSYFSGVANPGKMAARDLNGDGLTDIALLDLSNHVVSVFTNVGSGGFAPLVNYSVGNNPLGLALADMDGDGFADIVVANSSDNTVGILVNQGGATFAAQTTLPVGNQPFAPAVADFNGDDRPDIAVTNTQDNTITLLLQQSDKTFNAAGLLTTGSNPQGIAATDLTGDGLPDLAVINAGDATVGIFTNACQ